MRRKLQNILSLFKLLPVAALRLTIPNFRKYPVSIQEFKSDSIYVIEGSLVCISWTVENALLIKISEKGWYCNSNNILIQPTQKVSACTLTAYGFRGKQKRTLKFHITQLKRHEVFKGNVKQQNLESINKNLRKSIAKGPILQVPRTLHYSTVQPILRTIGVTIDTKEVLDKLENNRSKKEI